MKDLSNPLAAVSFIIPLNSKKEGDGLFSTHPNTKNRINILLKMANISRADFEAYNKAYESITSKKGLIKSDNSKPINIKESENIMAGALGLTGEIKAKAPDKAQIEEEIKKHREIEDLMWNLADYIIINCSCGTKLKLPQSYKGQTIACPHCKLKHVIE